MNPSYFHTNKVFLIFGAIFLGSVSAALLLRMEYLYLLPFGILLLYAGWSDPRLAFYLLLFTLPLSMEMGVSGNLSVDFPDELFMVFCSALFLCIWIFNPNIVNRQMLIHPLMLILFASLVWLVVPILSSEYPVFSFKFFAAKTWYIGAFIFTPLILLHDKQIILKSIKIISVSLFLVVLLSLARHAMDGFSFMAVNSSVTPFFRNHVNYSAMLVCFIPLFISFYRGSKDRFTRAILFCCIIVLIAALFFSYARGAWLALATGAAAWWLIRRKLLLKAYVAVMLIMTVLYFWIQHEKRYLQYAHDFRSTIYHVDFREHLRATYELRDVSTAERFYRWIAGAKMIREKPLTGFGPNTFYHHYKGYAVPAYKTWVSRNEERSTVHNYFLLVTIEQGIPGLLIFLLLAGYLFYYAQRVYHRSRDRFYSTVALNCGIILVMIMTVNFMSDLIETDKVGSLFFLCFSLLMIADLKTRRISS